MALQSWMTYKDFFIEIEPAREVGYRVKVQVEDGGEGEANFVLPSVETHLHTIQSGAGFFRKIGSQDCNSPSPLGIARDFGQKLFEAVFTRKVRDIYIRACKEADLKNYGLRLRLRLVNAPELADLPWEYLHDGTDFLALTQNRLLVRYIDQPDSPRPLEVALPLRILVFISSPCDLPNLDVKGEKAKIQAALHSLIESRKLELEFSQAVTLQSLQSQLRQARAQGKPFHALHFIGHGVFDPASQAGKLAFCDAAGKQSLADGFQLGTLLRNYPEIRLVLLNACEGARNSPQDPFAGVASALVEHGIPAVIGMQFEISDEAAKIFSEGFYSSLVDGLPVDAAVTEARRSIFFMPNQIEWATPVLFMRSKDGVLFKIVRLAAITQGNQIYSEPAELEEPVYTVQNSTSPRPPKEKRLRKITNPVILGAFITGIFGIFVAAITAIGNIIGSRTPVDVSARYTQTAEAHQTVVAIAMTQTGTARTPSPTPDRVIAANPATQTALTAAALITTPAATLEVVASSEPPVRRGNWLSLEDLPRTIKDFLVDPDNPEVAYAATGNYTGAGGGIFKSEDRGISWQRISTNLPADSVLALAIFQQGGSRSFLAALESGMYTSRDEAASWTETSNPGSYGAVHRLMLSEDGKSVYAIMQNEGLARSENGGQTWEPLNDGLPVRNNFPYVQALAIDPTNPMILYAGTGQYSGQGDGVYKSTDGGQNWSSSNRGMLDYGISALAVDPRQPQVIYAGCDSGDLFKSTDGGQNWTNLKDRLVLRQYGEPRQIHSIDIDPADGTLYVLGDNSGMLLSTDGGEKWSLLGNPPGVDQPIFTAVGILPGETPAILVAIDSPAGQRWRFSSEAIPVTPAASPVLTEAPGNATRLSGAWQPLSDLPRQVNTLVVDSTDPMLAFAGTGSGVFKSEDGGITWEDSSSGLNNLGIIALAFSAGDASVLYAASDRSEEIYASQDKGRTWSVKGDSNIYGTFGGQLIPSPADPNILYYTCFEQSSRSLDGGQIWLPLGDGLPKDNNNSLALTVAFDPTNPEVIYAGTGGFVGQGQGVYKSTDGGETWEPSNRGMLDYKIIALAVDPQNSQIVYAGSDNGDLFKSNDGGQNWSNLTDRLVLQQYGEPRAIRSIQIDPITGLVYLLGDNSGLLYSGDGGGKWRMVGNPPGTEQPRYESLAVRFGESPAFYLSIMDEGGAWGFGPQP